jgi:putative SOS response-associated peptidase YedK
VCGRFTQNYTWRELVGLYRLTQPARNLQPRYNIAPTTAIDVAKLADAGRELVPMRWDLIPGWWKKTAKEVPSTFNARAETVAEKPMFVRPSNAPGASCQRPAITSGARSRAESSPIS